MTGLDEHQVRRWTSWHRWTILAMLAHAFLAVTATTARAQTHPTPRLIALTANETRHLFVEAYGTDPEDPRIAHYIALDNSGAFWGDVGPATAWLRLGCR